MYPHIRDINLHAVNIIYLCIWLSREHILYLCEDCIHIGTWSKIYAVLCDKILRKSLAQLTNLHTLMSKRREEEGNTYKCITTIVALWIDYSTITFTTYNSAYFTHLCGHIHLTYGSSAINTTMLLRNITKGTCRTQIAYSSTRCMLKNIIGNAYKGIFLAEHLTILTDESKTVNIWVNNDSEVISALCELIHDTCEILLKRLWIMCKVTVRLAIQELILHSKLIKELWKDDTTDRVDRVNNNAETSILDCLYISKLKVEDCLYMTVIKVLLRILTHMVNISILKCFSLSNSKNLVAIILC